MPNELREYIGVRQFEGEPYRRWFMNDYFDLIVWENGMNEPIGLQLCYDIQYHERALTFKNNSYSHNKIDTGEDTPTTNRSPVLVIDGIFEAESVLKRFAEESKNIDEKIRNYVLETMQNYMKLRHLMNRE